MMAKRSKSKPTTPESAKSAPAQKARGAPTSKKLEISPIAREALMSSRLPRSPLDRARSKPMTSREVDAIRKFALALAEDGLGVDDDNVLICNRTTEPAAIPSTELLYDRCKWCDAEIYYDRLMPAPPNLVRVCVPCGIMLLEADKKGRN
jgi:hypothetical protein